MGLRKAEALTETTLDLVKATPLAAKAAVKGITSSVKGLASKASLVGGLLGGKGSARTSTTGSLRWYGNNVVRELITLTSGKSLKLGISAA